MSGPCSALQACEHCRMETPGREERILFNLAGNEAYGGGMVASPTDHPSFRKIASQEQVIMTSLKAVISQPSAPSTIQL